MAKKRKDHPKTDEAGEPLKKQAQKQQEVVPEIKVKEELVEEEEEEAVEDYEVEVEEEEEEEEEEDDNEEEDDSEGGEEEVGKSEAQICTDPTASSSQNQNQDDEEDEPVEKLLEPLSKDQLVDLLREAADKHSDIAERIRSVADEDPAHRKIFVHGLGWDTNAETLMNAFESYGEIEDCKAVCDKVSGKSKGYGFILFKKRSGARKALVEPQKRIGSRMTACQLASMGPVPAGSSAAPSMPITNVQQPVSEYTQRKIYVSNVGADLDPSSLYTFFSKFGEIEEGPLGLDKATGKPRGFCLFVYRTPDGAKKALEEPHKNFEGHMLHCQKAIDGPKPGKSHNQHQQYNMPNSRFQRNDNSAYSAGPTHLMAPAAGPAVGFNQGAAAASAFNPALGQALTALLASQGAGLGLTNLFGTLGSAAGVTQAGGSALQGVYGNQANISPGVIGTYGTQGAIQGSYPNRQMGQGSSGRGQHGAGQYGGAGPYLGH